MKNMPQPLEDDDLDDALAMDAEAAGVAEDTDVELLSFSFTRLLAQDRYAATAHL